MDSLTLYLSRSKIDVIFNYILLYSLYYLYFIQWTDLREHLQDAIRFLPQRDFPLNQFMGHEPSG